MMSQTRRDFLIKTGRAALAVGAGLIVPEWVYAGQKDVKIGNLNLETIDPRDTPTPSEYFDNSNSGSPLIVVPESLLEARVTKNFKLKEFAHIRDPNLNKGTGIRTQTHNGATYHSFIRLDPRLPIELQRLRDSYDGSLTVISPYRNVTYNTEVGGKGKSKHMSGQAADIAAGDIEKLYRLADSQFQKGGVGLYPTQGFVHVDVRGSRSRWTG